MRKEHPAFRMTSAKSIADNITFIKNLPGGVVAYTINGKPVKDNWEKILVIFNGNNTSLYVPIPKDNWDRFLFSGQDPYDEVTPIVNLSDPTKIFRSFSEGSILIGPFSFTLLIK